MRWLLLLTLVAALFATSRTSPILQRRSEVSLRTRTSAVGGHLRLPLTPVVDGDTMLLSGAGDGKEQAVSNNNDDDDDDEDRKTLSQQIADGKYGLLQNEIYTSVPERPGVISYDPNPEVPRDTVKNLGGLEQEEIWLAEDHVLVLRGGRYPDHKPNRTKPTPIWPPIDNYKAPPRQVKIPSNPKVPPPFPVQLTDDGPTQLLGPNGSKPIIIPPGNGSYFAPPFPFPPPPPGNFTPEDGPIYPPPPYYGYPPPGSLPSPSPPFQPSKNQSVYGQPPFPLPPPGNFTPGNGPLPFYPFPFPPPIRNGSLYPPPPGFFPPPRNGSLLPPPGFPQPPPFVNGSLPPGFFPPPGYFPPGAAFLPPPGILNDTFDEDDPSIYYPPPYDFFYPRDNTTQVPPGPLVPGIILPPPPNFFAPLNVSSTTIKITTTPTTTTVAPSTTTTERPNTSISSPPTSFLSRKKKPLRRPLLPSDDTVAFNQVTTEIPLRHYSKAVKGIVISTPSPVTYVVVPVTDINVSPQSPNKQSPFLVYQTSTQSPSSLNSNRESQYQGRGGISTTISAPFQNERAPKTSYYFYEEPHVAQGHLSETGVLKTQQGYYRNGYYYEPPTAVSTPSPQIYYNLPTKSTSPAPQVYYIPSRSPNPLPQAYYKIPPKSSTADFPVYFTPRHPTSPPSSVFYNVPTTAPPVYYYVKARPQQQQQQQQQQYYSTPRPQEQQQYYSTPRPQEQQQYYSTPRPQEQQQYYSTQRPSYHDVHPFKSNLQFYNSQSPHFETSRQVYQFSYDAHSLSTTTPRTPSLVALSFASTPRPASTPRTVYEYSFEKQPSNEIAGSYTTALSPVSQQFIGPTVRPQYLSKAQFVQPTVSPPYAVSTNSPSSTESPQYQHSIGNPLHVRPTIRPGAPFVVSTSNPQHAYYTPQDERLLDDITKKYFTIFGQKLGGASTTPMTPTRESYLTTTPQPISLEGDIAVNYHQPLPPVEPESELIEPARGPRINEGDIISYRLPGNDAHFYFLTPQARQRYRRRKTPR